MTNPTKPNTLNRINKANRARNKRRAVKNPCLKCSERFDCQAEELCAAWVKWQKGGGR